MFSGSFIFLEKLSVLNRVSLFISFDSENWLREVLINVKGSERSELRLTCKQRDFLFVVCLDSAAHFWIANNLGINHSF